MTDKAQVSENICVSIGEKDFGKCEEIVSSHPFCELRGDLCGLSEGKLEKLLTLGKKIIFTYRFKGQDKNTALKQTLAAIKNGVAFVDLDLGAPSGFVSDIKKAIEKQPSGKRTRLIISWHSDSTPSYEELCSKVRECKAKGADIVKIVPAAENLEEASRVLRLYFADDVESSSLVAFASGEAGRFTRIACTGLGAPFSYCYVGSPTAAGQLSLEEMEASLYPGIHGSTIRIGDLFGKKKKARSVCIPCSKSIVQRALLAAAITNGQSVLRNFEPCGDIKAAIAFARKCGCIVKSTREGTGNRGEKILIVKSAGIARWKTFQSAEAGESGLMLRMLLPVAAYVSSIRHRTAITSRITVNGSGSLCGRDLSFCMDSLRSAGVKCRATATSIGKSVPVTVAGASFRKAFTISGKETSQIVTGLLMVLPLLHHNTSMTVEEAASIPYIDLTVKVLEAFGIRISCKKDGRLLHFDIEGGQTYSPVDMFLESDWSGAANFIVGGAIASAISACCQTQKSPLPAKTTVNRMETGSAQADEKILEMMKTAGVSVSEEKPERKDFATVANIKIEADELKAFNFDATDCPDLFPILTTLAVYCNGTSRIKGVHRLVNKESNRAEAILLEFSRMGYGLHLEGDELVVCGQGPTIYNDTHARSNNSGISLSAGKKEGVFCSSHNDHRIAMAIIICALFRNYARSFSGSTLSDIYLDDIGCIDKSFPTFVERLRIWSPFE